jgi:hypothetical protein
MHWSKKTPLIAVTILAVALAVVSPIFSIDSVEGKRTGLVSGNYRTTGSITCPDGSTIMGTGISINASSSEQLGQYIIYGPFEEKFSGDISKVQINKNSFHLIGSGPPVCPSGSSDSSTVSFNGACAGAGEVQVKYEAKTGERGTLGMQGGC